MTTAEKTDRYCVTGLITVEVPATHWSKSLHETRGEAARRARAHWARSRGGVLEDCCLAVDGEEVEAWCDLCGIGLFRGDDYYMDEYAGAICSACDDSDE